MVGLDALGPSLRCPATGSPLSRDGDFLIAAQGKRRYPIVDGVPVLIAEDRSLFDIELAAEPPGREAGRPGVGARVRRAGHALLELLLSALPTRSRNVAAADNYRTLARLLRERSSPGTRPLLLVVGGRIVGAGTEEILDRPDIDVVETDVALGPRTQLVCDAHDLPFAGGSFDAVVVQAVVGSVLDPDRVAAEIHRVLREDGLVYSEAPFIQQVTEGALDFHRFTHLGHRRLWRYFDEISSGAQCGPGMALLWSLQHFAQAFVGGRRLTRALVGRIVLLGAFWLKYFDDFLVRLPGGIDGASGTFFLGRRRETALPDREIVRGFRGTLRRGQRLPKLRRADSS
jgi:SAM-dependent methyltransferase